METNSKIFKTILGIIFLIIFFILKNTILKIVFLAASFVIMPFGFFPIILVAFVYDNVYRVHGIYLYTFLALVFSIIVHIIKPYIRK